MQQQRVPPWVSAGLFLVLCGGSAQARPSAPVAFCDTYADAPTCAGSLPTCTLCHGATGEEDLSWNSYGSAVLDSLVALGHDFSNDSFVSLMNDALLDAEGSPNSDADMDGLSTLEEIGLGTEPGNADSYFVAPPEANVDDDALYDPAGYDPLFAFRKMMVGVCGRSPTYDEQTAFNASDDPAQALHDAADICLVSAYWLGSALAQLADDKIRLVRFNQQWVWDYRLWIYANMADRDARDVILADYHVAATPEGNLVETDGTVIDTACTTNEPELSECGFEEFCFCTPLEPGNNQGPCSTSGACVSAFQNQVLTDPSKRAGLLTTRWFHFNNTMFSAMPRTTAAQALRAYAGLDPARQSGLVHIENEPLDVDNKGVTGYTCKQCHMAVDTSAYAFSKYAGIGDVGGQASQYVEDRPITRGLWDSPNDEPQAYFLETPVDDLRGWATELANSEYFARHHVLTFFGHLAGREPQGGEFNELRDVWTAWGPEDAYSTNRMIHRILDTNAFGRP